MLFSSPLFLFVFFPIFFLLYLIGKPLDPQRKAILLVGSGLFYAWGEPTFVFVVLAAAILDWWLVKRMARAASSNRKKVFLTIGIAANVSLLVYFKYAGFLVANAAGLAHSLGWKLTPSFWEIALPLGISFITFEKITYIVDVYRGVGHPAASLRSYLVYVFFFPKLLAGPIIKYHDIEAELENRMGRFEDFRDGLIRFVQGLGKKLLIADNLGRASDQAFAMTAADLSASSAWIGILCYAFQIYLDFSGYSDMAIGMARMMGFHLKENFNQPYISQNLSEFWTRWHISLSTWIKEYLYIPLGGNRVSRARIYFNLWLCFLISGLWHGARWTFVLWGVYHGAVLIADRLFWIRVQAQFPKLLNIGITFVVITLSWVLFRSQSLAQAGYFYAALFFHPAKGLKPSLVLSYDIPLCLGVCAVLCAWPLIRESALWSVRREAPIFQRWGPELALLAAILCLGLSLGRAAMDTFHPFLYFRF